MCSQVHKTIPIAWAWATITSHLCLSKIALSDQCSGSEPAYESWICMWRGGDELASNTGNRMQRYRSGKNFGCSNSKALCKLQPLLWHWTPIPSFGPAQEWIMISVTFRVMHPSKRNPSHLSFSKGKCKPVAKYWYKQYKGCTATPARFLDIVALLKSFRTPFPKWLLENDDSSLPKRVDVALLSLLLSYI